jgi:CO/xanthine dehydrogenase Mo-binding subunit
VYFVSKELRGGTQMADLVGANGERQEFKIVGQPNIPGKLSYNIATGKAKFGSDAVVPDMVFAKFLRSPYAHAKVKSLDISKAKALPGVVDIVTWEDPDLQALRIGGAMFGGERPLLDNEADMEDDEVAVIVIAENLDVCDQALSLLKIDWEMLPYITDPRDGVNPDAPIIRVLPKGKGNIQAASKIDGDIEAGFKQADQIIEFDYVLPIYASHLPNPAGSVSWWYDDQGAGEGQTLRIEGATQATAQLAELYKLPFDKINQTTFYQGGRYCDWGIRKSQLVTPLLARKTGRPVRCVNTRQNTYDFAINRHFVHIKVGFKNDGLMTAVQLHTIADHGIRGSSNFATISDMNYGPFYTTRCLNIHQTMDAVSTNTGRMYLSGQHCPFGWDAMTIAEQLIAEKLGMDPIDVATRNIHGPSAQTDHSPQPSYQACMEAGKKMMKWEYHAAGTKKLPDGRMHGMAFRYQICPRHQISFYTCTIGIKPDGKIYMPTQGPCTGMYATDACAMVVAEEMGARYEDVIIEYDPKAIFTPVGGGSDGTSAAAWAAKEAAIACRKLILQTAADSLKAKPEDLDIKDSRIFLKSDPNKTYSFGQFAGNKNYLAATFTGRPPLAIWSAGMGKMLDTMNVLFCEVAVDTETGQVEVLKHGIVADPGKVLRRTSLESQLFQAMMFSEGPQLSEEFVFDKATGVKLSTNMFDYKKPTIVDIAPVDFELLETRAGNACYGASGISHSLANTHIIICAIENAIGKWIDPPATPDRVLRILGKA